MNRPVESIANEVVPFWNDEYADMQRLLPSHADIGMAPMSTGSDGFSTGMVERSWFSAEFGVSEGGRQISLQPAVSSAERTDMARARKIRIYPTAEQRELFRQWIGVQRFVYNRTVELLKGIDGPRPKWNKVANAIIADLPDFCREIPYQIKKIAVRDACKALTAGKVKAKQTGEPFELHFKSRKDPKQSCFIPKSAVKAEGIYHTISGRLKYSESLFGDFGDCRLVRLRRKWYLCVPESFTAIPAESQGRVVAVDPGVRTFCTFFGLGSFGHIGRHDIGRIQRLCSHLDDLISRSSKAKCGARRRMRMAADRVRDRITHLVDELHWKTIRFLTDNYDFIVFPTFESSQMVLRRSRRIRSKSVRQMLTWSFHRFAQRLEHKCFERGRMLIRVSEAYTSKTNSFTGETMDIGSREWFVHDGIRINRDINGARNILLRALVDSPLSEFVRIEQKKVGIC